MHLLKYEKNNENSNEKVSLVAILSTNVFITTFHDPLILTSNKVNYGTSFAFTQLFKRLRILQGC